MLDTLHSIPVSLGLPWFLGYALLRLFGIRWRTDRIAFVGWAWVLGALANAALVWSVGQLGMLGLEAWMPGILLGLSAGVLALALQRAPADVEGLPEARRLRGGLAERSLFRAALGLALLMTALGMLQAADALPMLTKRPFFAYWEPSHPLVGITRHSYWVGRISALALLLTLAGAMRCVVRPAVAALMLLILLNQLSYRNGLFFGSSSICAGLGSSMLLDGYLRWQRDGRSAWLALAGCGALLALGTGMGWPMASVALLTWLTLRLMKQTPVAAVWGLRALFLFALVALIRSNSLSAHGSQSASQLAALSAVFFPATFLVLALCLVGRGREPRLENSAVLITLAMLAVLLWPEFNAMATPAGTRWISVLPLCMLWIAACAGAQLGLSPSTHDPRQAARSLGALRPLRSVFIGYAIVIALGASLGSLRHLTSVGPYLLARQRASQATGPEAALPLAPGHNE